MARLSLSCLGPFQVALDGQPVVSFKSSKVRALLAYLALEANRPHPRESLAGLLWPDWPDRDALSNLRYALSNLRQVIGDRTAEPPFLLISRVSLQFNASSDHWLDVAEFSDLAGRDQLPDLERAISLCRGPFLEGLSIPDSTPFEEWTLFTRERLAGQLSSALHRSATAYMAKGAYQEALPHAYHLVELAPWDEGAHRLLMRALALSGQRGAALAQFKSCQRLLAEELDVQPAAETVKLVQNIRDGSLTAPKPSPPERSIQAPAFLQQTGPHEAEQPALFARENELGALDVFLDQALSGHGRVAFVTGEAGSGKTSLAQALARRALDAHPDLIVASGTCNAHTGVGDPYLPFRQIMEMLTGDVEASWAAGAISQEHARRLWEALPRTVRALAEVGPDLIDTFVPGTSLLDRAQALAPDGMDWLVRLQGLLQRGDAAAMTPGRQQSDLFEQYSRVLKAIAGQAPLLLLLDDLQWADAGAISLLFHLGRRLAGSQILVVCAYRSEEVAMGRDGARHPLQPIVNELQRLSGDLPVNLNRAKRQIFVDQLLDSEPNLLGTAFRDMLLQQTHGHPLFTIELLRGMQERGGLVQDQAGRWMEGPSLDWGTMPARVEAVIAERIGRLPQPLQDLLRVASVEGQVFTGEVVAELAGADHQSMLGLLSGELDRRHRLIRAQSIERVTGQLVSRYEFRHILFQRYVYSSLDEIERVHLHDRVGTALEALYGQQAHEVALQLAHHFGEAGVTHKAAHYLTLAGDRALHMSAYQEAIALLSRGLALLEELPDTVERAELELRLQLSLATAWQPIQGSASPKAGLMHSRALELCHQLGDRKRLGRVLGGLAVYHYVQAEHRPALDFGQQALELAHELDDPLQVALGHWYVGIASFALGEYTTALCHLERVIAFYEPKIHHGPFVQLRGVDPGPSSMGYQACVLYCLGYPDQALCLSQKAHAVARKLRHPYTLLDVLHYAGCTLHLMRRDPEPLMASADELVQLAAERVPGWTGVEYTYPGMALAIMGETREGIALMQKGMVISQSRRIDFNFTIFKASLAMALGLVGQVTQGLATVAEALQLVEKNDERCWEAELHRVQGDLLLLQGKSQQAEASYCRAIEVARQQETKSWELRAAIALARLQQEQGRTRKARELLAPIYDWFQEGFDTPDLIDAQALLEELA